MTREREDRVSPTGGRDDDNDERREEEDFVVVVISSFVLDVMVVTYVIMNYLRR